jgi:hypothetical protein
MRDLEAQETIQRINLALKLKEEEQARNKIVAELDRDAFINVLESGYVHELNALMNTVADPVASEIFIECVNRLDQEIHCDDMYKSKSFLKRLNQEVWDSFRLALAKQKYDEYTTNKAIILPTKGDEYYPNKPRVSYFEDKSIGMEIDEDLD